MAPVYSRFVLERPADLFIDQVSNDWLSKLPKSFAKDWNIELDDESELEYQPPPAGDYDWDTYVSLEKVAIIRTFNRKEPDIGDILDKPLSEASTIILDSAEVRTPPGTEENIAAHTGDIVVETQEAIGIQSDASTTPLPEKKKNKRRYGKGHHKMVPRKKDRKKLAAAKDSSSAPAAPSSTTDPDVSNTPSAPPASPPADMAPRPSGSGKNRPRCKKANRKKKKKKANSAGTITAVSSPEAKSMDTDSVVSESSITIITTPVPSKAETTRGVSYEDVEETPLAAAAGTTTTTTTTTTTGAVGAEAPKLDTTGSPVLELAAPSKQVASAYPGPCIVDTEKWRKKCLEKLEAEQERKKKEEKWAKSNWKGKQLSADTASAGYHHQYGDTIIHNPTPHSINQSEASYSLSAMLPDSLYSQAPAEYYYPGEGLYKAPQAVWLDHHRRSYPPNCGYWGTCCVHGPPDSQYPPVPGPGCCCVHAPWDCHHCLPTPSWDEPHAEEVFTETRAAGPEFTAADAIGQTFTEVDQTGQSFTPSQASTSHSLVEKPPRLVRSASFSSFPLPTQSSSMETVSSAIESSNTLLGSTQSVSDIEEMSKNCEAKSVSDPEKPASEGMSASPPSPPSAPAAVKMSPASSKSSGSQLTEKSAKEELAPSVVSLFEQARLNRPSSSPDKVTKPAVAPAPVWRSRTSDYVAIPLALMKPLTMETKMAQQEKLHAKSEGKPVDKAQDKAQEKPQHLAVQKTLASGATIEGDLCSPSLYYDAKQQVGSSPSGSSGSQKAPLKSSLKKPSTPSPTRSQRSSVRLSPESESTSSSGTPSPPQEPVSKSGSPASFHSRVSSKKLRRHKSTAGYVRSLFGDTDFADLEIILSPASGPTCEPKVFKVHKAIVAASPFLCQVMQFKQEQDGTVDKIHVHSGAQFTSSHAFGMALQTLYGKPLVCGANLRRVTLEGLGYQADNGAGTYDFSLELAQVDFALCYAAAGAFLSCREITERGIHMALDLMSWETAEVILAFGMFIADYMLICADIPPSAPAVDTPRSSSSRASETGNLALRDFHFIWADVAIKAALQFFASNMKPDFELYGRAQAKYVDRILPPLWTLPGSSLTNPQLEGIKFGSMPSFDEQRPTRADILVLSAMLITLPYGYLAVLLDLMKVGDVLTVALMKEIVEKREERRLQALRIYLSRSWGPGELPEPALNELGFREFVAVEDTGNKDESAVVRTTSVQRVWVGLAAPSPVVSMPPRPQLNR